MSKKILFIEDTDQEQLSGFVDNEEYDAYSCCTDKANKPYPDKELSCTIDESESAGIWQTIVYP